MYEQCGFERNSGLATVQMLGNMEARLEELSLAAADLSPEVMFASQKQREKDRRQVQPSDSGSYLACITAPPMSRQDVVGMHDLSMVCSLTGGSMTFELTCLAVNRCSPA